MFGGLENDQRKEFFLGVKARDHQDDQAYQDVQRHKDSRAACDEDGVDLDAGQASSWAPREAPLGLSAGKSAVTSSAVECARTSSDSVLLRTSADAELALLMYRGIAVQQNHGATAVMPDFVSTPSVDDPKAVRKLVLTSKQ